MEWDVASNVLATLYNTRAFADGKKRVEPWQCNPFHSHKKPAVKGDITCLKALLRP